MLLIDILFSSKILGNELFIPTPDITAPGVKAPLSETLPSPVYKAKALEYFCLIGDPIKSCICKLLALEASKYISKSVVSLGSVSQTAGLSGNILMSSIGSKNSRV